MLLSSVLLMFVGASEKSFAYSPSDCAPVPISVKIQGIGLIEVNAIICNERLYLPITDILEYLKIKNRINASLDTVIGNVMSTSGSQGTFLIDKRGNKLKVNDTVIDLDAEALYSTESNLYMRSDYFGTAFGLDCGFNFRSLSLNITTTLELPMVRDMRLTEMRKNISKLNGEIKVDTTIRRKYHLLQVGMADWSVIAAQLENGVKDVRANLGLGFTVFGGETIASLNYSNNIPFAARQQYYLWRYVNNESGAVKQVSLGKIYTPLISSIFAPVVGAQVTNASTAIRRSFGTYKLSNTTKPGWTVELYVNNVLVDYKKADQSGFYSFDVPLVYGNSAVRLRFYGPYGEESTKEEYIEIPFNFLPEHAFEYTASAGIVEDDKGTKFSRVNMAYGAAQRLTIGGSAEYLSSISSAGFIPFVNTNLRVTSGLLFSGEYAHGVRAKGLLSYRLPSNLLVELNYSKYAKGQTAINNNYLEERKLMVSLPIRASNFSVYTRLNVNEIILAKSKLQTAEWMITSNILGVNTNISTYASRVAESTPYTFTNLSLAFKLPYGFLATPQAQYAYYQKEFISFKFLLEKNIFKTGFLNISYEKNIRSGLRNCNFGFRYDFKYAQVGFSSVNSNRGTSFIETARGSMMYDPKNKELTFSNKPSVGRGGIIVSPFLDLNCNGLRETDEPKAPGFKFSLNGGRSVYNNQDTTIHVFDLEPYRSYILEPNRSSFDNIAWQLNKKVIGVAIAPNQFTAVDIPIAVVGEVSGRVYFKDGGRLKGQGRVTIAIYNDASELIAKVLSEEDGYFNYIGLPPGNYSARLDDAQLRKLNLIASPATLPIIITRNREGDLLDGLKFVLSGNPALSME